MVTGSLCYDLHSHTTYSDGELTPVQLVERAIINKVDVLAITDHDTVSGLDEAKKLIINNKLPIILVNGIELSTSWGEQDIHIVGLNINIENDDLVILLKKQKAFRVKRAQAISKKLADFGIISAYQHAKRYANSDVISRSHFARYLVEIGATKNISMAFKKYLGKNKKAYFPPEWSSIEEAVRIIHLAGGQAVLAHPMRYNLTKTKLQQLFDEFKKAEGDAIEVSYNGKNNMEQKLLEQYLLKYGFLASQGSDFHGMNSHFDLGQVGSLSDGIKPIWHNWSLFSHCR